MKLSFSLKLLYWRIFHPKTYAAWKLIMSIDPSTLLGMVDWEKADKKWQIDKLPKPGCRCVLCQKMRDTDEVRLD